MKVIHVDAQAQFMAALEGVSDPEQKRKIIGREFVEVFQREAAKVKNAKWLAQGTIYPDVIESAGGKTKKAHHHQIAPQRRRAARNAASETARAAARAVQRRSARAGPGARSCRTRWCTGIRFRDRAWAFAFWAKSNSSMRICYGGPTRSSSKSCVQPDGTKRPAQAFAVFLPVRSVGVMGDGRTYEYVVALRAVQTEDFMTAHWAELPHALLSQGVEPHHQRSARHQPRGIRHLRQAACDDRVGVI